MRPPASVSLHVTPNHGTFYVEKHQARLQQECIVQNLLGVEQRLWCILGLTLDSNFHSLMLWIKLKDNGFAFVSHLFFNGSWKGLSLSSFDVKSPDTYLIVSNQSDCVIWGWQRCCKVTCTPHVRRILVLWEKLEQGVENCIFSFFIFYPHRILKIKWAALFTCIWQP